MLGHQIKETSKLHVFASNGDINKLKRLLEKQRYHNIINNLDDKGNTPLAWAVFYGHLDTVKLLLDKGADSKIKGTHGENVLHWAASCNHKDIAALLLSKGLSVNDIDNDGATPLH